LWNEEIILLKTINASGTIPPPNPEWTAFIGWSTTIVPSTSPLKEVVTVGNPDLIFPGQLFSIPTKNDWPIFNKNFETFT